MAPHYQAATLIASPSYPNAIAWSSDNIVAVASGHIVTILFSMFEENTIKKACLDALKHEKLHEENEKLFDRVTEKSRLGSAPQASSPSANKPANGQGREIGRSDSSKSRSPDVFASPVSQDKTGNSGAIVKSSNELAKTTPAGEYLTSALMDFDPDQFEGFVAIVDGANKLLML
ncbi:Kinesin-like protein KCA2, partial [Zea mays]